MGESGIERLPEKCRAYVISLTSPRDACRASAVSSAFRSTAASDTVWDRFLPPDCQSLLSRAIHPVESASKRDLFFRLCDSVLIDGGRMSFWLDRWSGAKCFMLSARQLFIVWGDTPRYWRWRSMPDSRFSEVAELRNVCWLEISGKIDSRMLSRKTTYAVYFIYKLTSGSYGLDHPPQEASVTIGAHSSRNMVRLLPQAQQQGEEEADEVGGDGWIGGGRWMEVEMGEFYNDEGEHGEVVLSLMEVRGGHWKTGLIVEGIQIRPKK